MKQTQISVLPDEKHIIQITWNPTKPGGYRNSITFKYEGVSNQAFMLGKAYEKEIRKNECFYLKFFKIFILNFS